jgi:hypothetical protein
MKADRADRPREKTMMWDASCRSRLACAALVLLLAACGGGGGGGGSPDLSTAPGITVSPASFSFAAVHNGALPPTQVAQITISAPNAAFVGLAVPAANPPTWLDLSQARLTPTSWTAAIVSTSLAPGTYTTTVSIGIGDINGNIIAYRNVQLSYTITAVPIAASPNNLNFSSVVGGPPPAAQPVALMGDVGPWTALADQPWIGVAPSSGNGVGSVNISTNPTGLVPGTYNGSVTFTSGSNTAVVNVSLTVVAPAIQTNLASLSFSGINGATLAPQSLSITMNNGAAINWTAATPPADTWLVLDRTSGTASDPLGVSVNPAIGTLASGIYNSSISLQGSSGASTFNKTVNVTMTLTKATLTANPVSVTLGGSNGRDFSGVPLQLSLNTGANSFSWNSTANSFIQRSPSLGSVSATPLTVTVTPNPTGLLGGTHNGSITFALAINGDSVSTIVPVTFNQEAHKLLVDGNGIAFTKTPSLSSLTRTLRVRDNLGLATPWTASSDQTWLSVTANGTSDSDIVFTANPGGLTPDSVNLATVTITSSDASVENTEKVRVGLWVGATDPDPTTTVTGLPFVQIVADPIRPYVYSATRDSLGFGRDIIITNVHNGSGPPPIIDVGVQIGAIAVSHDGSTLYAFDNVSGRIVPVDLDTHAVGTPFNRDSLSNAEALAYTRTNGVPLVISNGQIFNAAAGAILSSGPFGAVAASRNGSRMCSVDIGNSTYSLSCLTLDFTSLNGGQFLFDNFSSVSGVGVNASDVALSPDGTVAYVASGAGNLPPELSPYSTQDLSHQTGFPIQGRGNNVEIAPDGRIFAGSTNVSIGQTADVRVFDAAGNLLATRLISPGGGISILDRQMRISGDGLRLITITGNPPLVPPSLVFTTVAP